MNFGHSFGHALETLTGYERFLHGEAVAIGMCIAARLSELRGICDENTSSRIAGLLERIGLPTKIPGNISNEDIVDVMALDKKVLAGQSRLILLNSLGEAIIDTQSSQQEIRTALDACR